MAQSRQLAAIMFTDVVGYTALMNKDEDKAFELLHTNRRLHKPLIEQYNGRWIKELGDGVLASFSNVTDAVLCAIHIQKTCDADNDYRLRIAIHSGEVVFEDDDVFGDGVNIASRLQSFSPVGGICISESVNNNLINKKEITTRFLSEERLKNVSHPVKIYEVIFANGSYSSTKQVTKKIPDKSIAVLPFVNMSNDPEQEYFSDGMAEEILNSLTRLNDLKVAGRTSSFQFKGKNIDLREVGEKLNVRTVLEGSVRKQANRLRITAQLINVEDGYHLWSERYDREMDDIFAIQDEIAISIAEKLKITLLRSEKELIDKKPTDNKEAYELYLKGRFYTNRRGSALGFGMQCFEQAIAVDKEFALAYAGYADASLLLAFYNFLPAKEVMPKAKQAAETAIRLDDSISEPHTSLGFYYSYFEWNKKKGRYHYKKALEINPKYAQGHFWYAMFFLAWIESDFAEAEREAKIACDLEPLSAIVHAILSTIYYTSNRFEEAIRTAKAGIEMDAGSYLSYRMLGLSYMESGQADKAIEILKQCVSFSSRFQWAVNDLLWAYCCNGDRDEALALMDELKQRASKENICYSYLAMSSAYLGNLDEAVAYVGQAYDNREPTLLTLKIKDVPTVPKTLQADARFAAIINRIQFIE